MLVVVLSILLEMGKCEPCVRAVPPTMRLQEGGVVNNGIPINDGVIN